MIGCASPAIDELAGEAQAITPPKHGGFKMALALAAKKKQLSSGLAHVEELAEVFASARQELSMRVGTLEADLLAIKRNRIASIRAAAAVAKDARAALEAAIEANKAEFEKPKTRTFHGIKVGFRKLVGTISWKDGDKVVALIKKHFPDQSDVLIRQVETPVKDALANLPVSDLKKIGCSVQDDTDELVIKAEDSAVDKLVDALLKETAEVDA